MIAIVPQGVAVKRDEGDTEDAGFSKYSKSGSRLTIAVNQEALRR